MNDDIKLPPDIEEQIRFHPTPLSFTFYHFSDCDRWTRIRLALALVLSPFTIAMIGRSIKVTLRPNQK